MSINKNTHPVLKPTNEEIIEYILSWIDACHFGGLITIHDRKTIKEALSIDNNFDTLREMFAPVMYDSIQEYVEKEK